MGFDTPHLKDPALRALGGRDVHVWRVSLPDRLDPADWGMSVLNDDERRRAARYAHARSTAQFVGGRVALRQLLSSYLARRAADVILDVGDAGKPRLAGIQAESGICFNLSHSRGAAVCAFACHRRLGIDLEFRRPGIDVERIARRFFTPLEVDQLTRVGRAGLVDAFYACWTRKEAYLKASGRGLGGGLRRFSVDLKAGADFCPAPLLAADEPTELDRWRLLPLELWADYAAALCVEGADWRVRVADWDVRTGAPAAGPSSSVDD